MRDSKGFPDGSIVYEPYRPQFYGKVLRRIDQGEYAPWFLVKWMDGSEREVRAFHLRSLDDLIADHEKKLNTHKKTLEKAREL